MVATIAVSSASATCRRRQGDSASRPWLAPKQPKEFCLQYNKGHCPLGKRCKHKHRYNRRIDGGVSKPRFCNSPHAAVDHDQLNGKGNKGSGKDKNKGAGKNKQKWRDKWKTKR